MSIESDNMKVLSVCTSDTSGGAARAAYRIQNGVKLFGVDSRMFVKTKGSSDEDVISLDDFLPKDKLYPVTDWIANKVKNKWQHYKWHPYSNKEKYYLSDLRSTSIHGALQILDYDILHLHWVNLRFLDLRELKKVGKPILWTLHDSWPFCGVCHYFLDCNRYKTHCGDCPMLHFGKERDLAYQVFEKKRKYFDGLDLHVVTPSKWLGDCARQSTLLGDFPVTVIPNCLDTDVFSPRNKEAAIARWLPDEEKRFGKTFVLYGAANAATDKIKGFSNLLSALQIMQSRYDCSNIELLVFGTDKPVDALQLDIPIHYLGQINNDEDLSLLYSLADVMVLPSLTENLSCAIMESLSCGTPVVAFDIGGNRDMIEHKRNGYLAGDDADMADGIGFCIKEGKDILGSIARETVEHSYSSSVIGQRYKELYSQLLNS